MKRSSKKKKCDNILIDFIQIVLNTFFWFITIIGIKVIEIIWKLCDWIDEKLNKK